MISVRQETDGDRERHQRTISKLRTEMGPVLLAVLGDPFVTDIHRNADDRIWVSRLGKGSTVLDIVMSDWESLNLIGTVSGWIGQEVSAKNPHLECEFPLDGSRFTATLPPIAEAPVFSIRKHSLISRNLDDYVRDGAMTPAHAQALRKCIRAKDNILIVGEQGSGKSTLANAILREMVETSDPAFERFGILEDTPELQIDRSVNHVRFRSTSDVDLQTIVRWSLRHTNSRFIVGELRGKEARAWLDALTTGHNGSLTTVHAGGSRGALYRLEQLLRQSGAPIDKEEIAKHLQLIIFIAKTPAGRIVREMTRIADASPAGYNLQPLLKP